MSDHATESACFQQRTAAEACRDLDLLEAALKAAWARAHKAYEEGDYEMVELILMSSDQLA